MGLLDDAIREHLDLKRARGGDPAEIERMEREALGPVRREPTFGSTRLEAPEQHLPVGFEPVYDDERLTDLEDLQEHGYHDSTAPHPHRHEYAHPHDGHADSHLDFEDEPPYGVEFEQDEVEQPRRRFLRRNRPASLSEPLAGEPGGAYEQPAADHADFHDYDEPLQELPHDASPPPQLQFEHPPKRPRFTAEPPELQPESLSGPGAEPQDPTPPPAPARDSGPRHESPETAGGQETTEFDVQRHLAETRHEPDEDMLEETPEFLQDTPEHDRLWFEQRPPRDFDFDG